MATKLELLADGYTKTLRMRISSTTLSPQHNVDFEPLAYHCQVFWTHPFRNLDLSPLPVIAGHWSAGRSHGLTCPPKWPIGGSRRRTDSGAKIQQLLRMQSGFRAACKRLWPLLARGKYRPNGLVITGVMTRGEFND